LRAIKRFIKKERIHYIFDLHNNFRSNYLRRNSKAESVNHIRKDKLKQVALVSFKKNYYDSIIPIPERYFQVGKDFGLMPDSKGLELFWNDDYYGKVEHFIQNKGINPEENYISIAPGASFDNKKWPIEYFEETIQEVSKELKCRVVVLGDKNDQELGKRLADNNDNVYDMTGQLSMLESAIVMSKSIALLSNDSGLMHMATAVNTPVLAIFGPTVRELGFFPYKAIHSVVEMKNLQCRPCSHMGKNRCPKKHFRCMRDITPEIVYKNLIQLVRGN
jgi:ADP-heptose:LPS heptosyltransferase